MSNYKIIYDYEDEYSKVSGIIETVDTWAEAQETIKALRQDDNCSNAIIHINRFDNKIILNYNIIILFDNIVIIYYNYIKVMNA